MIVLIKALFIQLSLAFDGLYNDIHNFCCYKTLVLEIIKEIATARQMDIYYSY